MEIFDIVDENGTPTGETVERSKAHDLGIRHRTAHIWIIRKSDSGYDVLLQRRSANKDSHPNQLDTSSAGHITAGDEPINSAIRELSEELGIYVGEEDLAYAGKFLISYSKEFHGKMFSDNEVAFVYVYDKPVDEAMLVLQKEEVQGVEWHDFKETYNSCVNHNSDFCVPIGGLEILKNYLKGNKYDY